MFTSLTWVRRDARRCGLAAAAALAASLLFPAAADAQVADLSDWAGNDNTSGNNNYVVTSPTSAGGAIQVRFPGAFLGDTSLNGVPDSTVSYDSPLSVSGTLTFNESGEVDPNFWLGFFNRDASGEPVVNEPQVVIAPADNGLADSFRWIIRASDGVTPQFQVVDANIPDGTYSFSLSTDGSGLITASIGSFSNSTSVTLPAGTTFDTLGFGQSGGSDAATFTLSVSDITYTGQTPVPEPAGLAVLAAGGLLLAARRRRRCR